MNELNFPVNCQFGIRYVHNTLIPSANTASHANNTVNVDKSKTMVVCAACQPGYRPKEASFGLNKFVPFMIGKCEEIQNCVINS